MLCNTDILRGSLLLLGATAASSMAANAQSHLYTLAGDGMNDRLGFAVAAAGDVNGDSYPDFIAGAPENFDVFALQAGYAKIYSGLDGSTILTLNNAGPGNLGEKFGSAVDGVGDLNNDGFDDVIVGAPGESSAGSGTGEARVFSGQDGAELFSVKGDGLGYLAGTAVSGAGDVNGDGVPDFIVGMPGAPINGSNSGLVRVYSGVNGLQLFEVLGVSTSDRFGVSVDAAGDVNGDGFDDIIVGSYYAGARVLSGVDGSLIRSWAGDGPNDFFGIAVRGVGDVTGDSVPDFMVGAVQPTVFIPGGKGYAKVLNGATGAELFHFGGLAGNDRFGTGVDLAGDYNGDGLMDFLVSADQPSLGLAGYAQVFSGVGGALLATFDGAAADNYFGTSLAYLGDINGDGTHEFAIGEPHESSTVLAAGRVSVKSGASAGCGLPQTYCTSLANSTGVPASISFLGSNSVASNDLFLIAMGLPTNQFGIFFYGSGITNSPLGNGLRCVASPAYRLPLTTTGSGGSTAWLLDNTTPPEAGAQITVGSTWFFQYWYRDPAAGGGMVNLTDGLMVPFCP